MHGAIQQFPNKISKRCLKIHERECEVGLGLYLIHHYKILKRKHKQEKCKKKIK